MRFFVVDFPPNPGFTIEFQSFAFTNNGIEKFQYHNAPIHQGPIFPFFSFVNRK